MICLETRLVAGGFSPDEVTEKTIRSVPESAWNLLEDYNL